MLGCAMHDEASTQIIWLNIFLAGDLVVYAKRSTVTNHNTSRYGGQMDGNRFQNIASYRS